MIIVIIAFVRVFAHLLPPAAVGECNDWLDLQGREGPVVTALVAMLVIATFLRCCSDAVL